MKNLFSKILIGALIGLFVGSATAALVGPVKLNGGNSTLPLSAGTTSFSVPSSGLGCFVLRSVVVHTAGSNPTGATEVVTVAIADDGITNTITFNMASNSATASGGRLDLVGMGQFTQTSTINGTNVSVTTTAGSYTNFYVYPGAVVTVTAGTNGGRCRITADAYTGSNP